MNKEQQALIQELIQKFESASAYNDKMFRTILANDQKQLAKRIKETFGVSDE